MKGLNTSELKRNTIFIAISSFGSKIINFILAPMYSYFMNTSQYGQMDLITTTVNLLLPFISLNIYAGTFRFSIEASNKDQRKVISNSLLICCFVPFIILIVLFILQFWIKIPGVIFICVISAILDSLIQTTSDYVRGKDNVKLFATFGILSSVVLFFLNLFFLVLLKYELKGWIYSFIITKIIILIYILLRIKIWREFSVKLLDKIKIKKMLQYSTPLIAASSMWWVMNASDRYAISYFLNNDQNGIYAVANKLPAILSLLENVFYQSWETTANKVIKNNNSDEILTNVFNKYFKLLSIGILGLLIVLKPLIVLLFEESYIIAWKCSGILVMCVMVHALAGNLGTIYGVYKKTNGAFLTALVGAIVNIVLNIIFIPKYGIIAAGCTTLASYICVLIIRLIDTKKYVKINLHLNTAIIYILLLFIQLFLFYSLNIYSYCLRFLIFSIVLFINRKDLIAILKIKVRKNNDNEK